MSSDNYKTIVLSLPAAALLTISQAAIGCGIGILLADKVTENKRNTAAIGMLCMAIASTAPALVGVVLDLINGHNQNLGCPAGSIDRKILAGSGEEVLESISQGLNGCLAFLGTSAT
jgi:hypothetical protein